MPSATQPASARWGTVNSVLDSVKVCRLLYNNPVQSESAVILLRSRLLSTAQRMGFPEIKRENMALVVSELVSNQIKHAGGRGMLQIWQQPGGCLDLLALDFGPGIVNLRLAEEDGYSTVNTLGKGLGSIRRLSDEVAIYTQPETPGAKRWSGTAIMARFRLGQEGASPVRIGMFSRALSDERFNGDRIYLLQDRERVRWLHLDGLGHGEIAHETTSALGGHVAHSHDLANMLAAVDHQLVGSRGAVGIAGELDLTRRMVELQGVGDMHAHLFDQNDMHNIAFAPGILGREHKAASVFRTGFGPGGLVITASDGIRRNWETSSFPGLFHQHPQLIAYVVGNIMGRISDDQSLCIIGAH
jgi:anti-sigma regulatory factor (Ser/Thr protein kinase)